jgi:hypothetical protein
MRPFVQGDGLSALPEFEDFTSNPEFKALQEDLKSGRNFVFAHHSDSDPLLFCPRTSKRT